MLFLTRQVGRNPLATGYYIQLKELLEDLLMLELAQRVAEATMKFYTRNKTLVINDQSLVPFRSEMEKAKTLKLVSGVLSLSGCLDVESVLDKVTTKSHNNIVNHEICSSLAKLFCGAYNTFNKLYEGNDTIYMVYHIMAYLIQNIPELNSVDLSSAENVAEKFCTIVQGKLNSHV